MQKPWKLWISSTGSILFPYGMFSNKDMAFLVLWCKNKIQKYCSVQLKIMLWFVRPSEMSERRINKYIEGKYGKIGVDRQVIVWARNLRVGANCIPPKSFRACRAYFSNEDEGNMERERKCQEDIKWRWGSLKRA